MKDVKMKAHGYELEATGRFVFEGRGEHWLVGIEVDLQGLPYEHLDLFKLERGALSHFRIQTNVEPFELREVEVLKGKLEDHAKSEQALWQRIRELEAKLEAREDDDG